jgi:hypothetical protein
MKKILVVFMILAVAGGVFAQEGTWSLSSNAHIGARVNLDPDPEREGDVALIRGSMYQRPYSDYTSIFGDLGIRYTRGPLGVGLRFSTEGLIEGTVSATGDNYRFAVESNLNEFLGSTNSAPNAGNPATGSPEGNGNDRKFLKRLWGSYSMLDGLVSLEVAYRSRDFEMWASDKTGAIDDNGFQAPNTYQVTGGTGTDNWVVKKLPINRDYRVIPGNISNYNAATPSGGLFKDWNTFTKVDLCNFLLANVSVGGLQMGIMVPNMFTTAYTRMATSNAGQVGGNGGRYDGMTPPFTAFPGSGIPTGYSGGGRYQWGNQFVEDVLAQSIFGAKFNVHPVEVAAQLKFQDFGVYFGAKFFAGPVTAGLSFMGIMSKIPLSGVTGNGGPQFVEADEGQVPYGAVYDATVTKIGGRVDYNGGSFGAGIKGFYGMQGGKDGVKDADGVVTSGDGLERSFKVIGIEPTFFINAIPSHLRFTLDAGFYFETYTAPALIGGAISDVKKTFWALQPAISWNFRGTGAVGGYHSMNTGMFFRYRIVSNAVNALDIAFLFGL